MNNLEKLLDIGNLSDIEAYLVSCAKDGTLWSRCLDLATNTKICTGLSVLKSFLSEDFPFLDNVVKDDKFSLLEKYFPEDLKINLISRLCGINGIAYELIPKAFQGSIDYAAGLILVDNLDLFLKYFSRDKNWANYLLLAALYCARRIMTDIGFSDQNVLIFLEYAYIACNKDTLLFILDKCSAEQIEKGFLLYLRKKRGTINYLFIVDCFGSGLITLSETGWQRLKEIDLELYQKVENDV